MSLEENKTVVRRWIKELNQRNLDVLDALMANDFYHPTRQLRGPEEYKQLITMMSNAFPDWHETLEDIIAEGDKVWHRFKVTGTHKGEFYGLFPTGKKVKWTGVNFWRIVDGKVIEKDSLHDMLETLKQLGAIEPTEKGKKLFPEG